MCRNWTDSSYVRWSLVLLVDLCLYIWGFIFMSSIKLCVFTQEKRHVFVLEFIVFEKSRCMKTKWGASVHGYLFTLVKTLVCLSFQRRFYRGGHRWTGGEGKIYMGQKNIKGEKSGGKRAWRWKSCWRPWPACNAVWRRMMRDVVWREPIPWEHQLLNWGDLQTLLHPTREDTKAWRTTGC